MPVSIGSPLFSWSPRLSLRANLQDQLKQNEPGPFLRDLTRAMLSRTCPDMPVSIRKNLPKYADLQVLFDGCLEIGDTIIHVVPNVGEAVVRHCAEDLVNGYRPLVLALDEGVPVLRTLLGYAGLAERVDVMDALDFLATGLLSLVNFRMDMCQHLADNLAQPF